jgi:hypothetical protein
MNARAVVTDPISHALPLGGSATTAWLSPQGTDILARPVEDVGAAQRRPVLTAHWVIGEDRRLVCQWHAADRGIASL